MRGRLRLNPPLKAAGYKIVDVILQGIETEVCLLGLRWRSGFKGQNNSGKLGIYVIFLVASSALPLMQFALR